MNKRCFQLTGCKREKDEESAVTDFIAQIKENKIVVSFNGRLPCRTKIAHCTILQFVLHLLPSGLLCGELWRVQVQHVHEKVGGENIHNLCKHQLRMDRAGK